MSNEELLLKLRDIAPPPEAAWYLLGPAWIWLGLGLIALVAGIGLWYRAQRRSRLARLAEEDLQVIRLGYQRDRDDRLLAIQLSRWLKQVALLAFPSAQLQQLNGSEWLSFLDQQLEDRPFTRGCGQVFGGAVYQPQVELDAAQVIGLCERWLQLMKPRLQHQGRAA